MAAEATTPSISLPASGLLLIPGDVRHHLVLHQVPPVRATASALLPLLE